jgi:hypothetical protein
LRTPVPARVDNGGGAFVALATFVAATARPARRHAPHRHPVTELDRAEHTRPDADHLTGDLVAAQQRSPRLLRTRVRAHFPDVRTSQVHRAQARTLTSSSPGPGSRSGSVTNSADPASSAAAK